MSATQTLPKNWTRRRLRFDVNINPVKSSLKADKSTDVSFVPMEAVGENGGLKLAQTKPISDVYNGYTYFEDGDVCLAKITPCFENGKASLAEGLHNGIAFGTTELHILRPHEEIDKKFLFYSIIAHDFRSFGESEMLGAGGQKRVPEDFLKDWKLSLPPLSTQQRIAAYLDDKTARIDALISKKRALLDRLAEKRQALITQAVTKGLNPNTPFKPSNIPWLGDIPEHWEVVPLKWSCSIQSGQVDPREEPYINMPLVAPDHIESGTGKLLEVTTAEEQGAISGKYLCHKNTVLYSKIRPALRKVALHDDECLCSADMYAIDPERHFDRHYLFYFLLTDAFSDFAILESMRVAMPKINREALGAFKLPKPKLSEQRQIAENCIRVDQCISQTAGKIQTSITHLTEYRAALITAAVTGRIAELATP